VLAFLMSVSFLHIIVSVCWHSSCCSSEQPLVCHSPLKRHPLRQAEQEPDWQCPLHTWLLAAAPSSPLDEGHHVTKKVIASRLVSSRPVGFGRQSWPEQQLHITANLQAIPQLQARPA